MYAELYKAWKTEKANQTFQSLPKDFYQRAAAYVKSLDEELTATDAHTVQGRVLAREKEMTQRLLEELKQTRLHKIILAAQNQIPIETTQLTQEEITVVNEIKTSLSSLNEREKHVIEETARIDKLIVVRFLQEIPEIVGTDLKIYGPFKKEDVASLPTANAEALTRQGAAKVIEVKIVSERDSEFANNK